LISDHHLKVAESQFFRQDRQDGQDKNRKMYCVFFIRVIRVIRGFYPLKTEMT